MHVLAGGLFEFDGQKHEYFNLNLATIEQPQEGVDLSKAKLLYWDGLNDNWYGGSKEAPWPNGLL